MSNASTSVLSSFAIRGGKSDVSRTPRGKKSSSRREQNEEDENDRTADLPPNHPRPRIRVRRLRIVQARVDHRGGGARAVLKTRASTTRERLRVVRAE